MICYIIKHDWITKLISYLHDVGDDRAMELIEDIERDLLEA